MSSQSHASPRRILWKKTAVIAASARSAFQSRRAAAVPSRLTVCAIEGERAMVRALRAEEASAGIEDGLDAEILHAVVRADGGVVAGAVEVGLEDLAEAVELELVAVERVV